MRISDSNSIGNDNDLGEHYGNVNSKQLLWTTLNMISQNNLYTFYSLNTTLH